MVSATLAPIALIGGWTVAARQQPAGYSAVHQTISALAARGAHDRWIMTIGLFLLGASHLVTAAGLRPAATRGRIVLAIGGVASVGVAVFPQPHTGSSVVHVTSATIGFIALAIWPVFAARRSAHSLLARPVSATASIVMLALLGWFAAALSGGYIGLAERFIAGTQSLWPLAVVISTFIADRPGDHRPV